MWSNKEYLVAILLWTSRVSVAEGTAWGLGRSSPDLGLDSGSGALTKCVLCTCWLVAYHVRERHREVSPKSSGKPFRKAPHWGKTHHLNKPNMAIFPNSWLQSVFQVAGLHPSAMLYRMCIFTHWNDTQWWDAHAERHLEVDISYGLRFESSNSHSLRGTRSSQVGTLTLRFPFFLFLAKCV